MFAITTLEMLTEFTPKENTYGNTRYLVEAAIISTIYRFFYCHE